MPLFSSTDLAQARQRLAQSPWATAIFARLRARADIWCAQPISPPSLAGGGFADYVCPAHWRALIANPASPFAHACPCGEQHTGEKLDAAWRTFEHYRIAACARDLALVYTLTDTVAYADAARTILMQYAQMYNKYTGLDDPRGGLRGRVFAHAVAEAQWSVALIHAYMLVRDMLLAHDKYIVNGLLRPLVGVMATAQKNLQAPNLLAQSENAWIIAALGMLGYALDDRVLVEHAIDGATGFRAHLSAAITADGWAREGSPYVHLTALRAYTLLAETARANGRDLYAVRGADGQSIEAMWHALASLAFADGVIPALGDGMYWQPSSFASELTEAYEIALARTQDLEFAWLLGCHYRQHRRDAWSAVLFGERDVTDVPQPARAAICFQSAGIALLRDHTNAQEICVSFGSSVEEHTHLDRLCVSIYPFALDPGTPPGEAARTAWYCQTVAHNGIVVDGGPQAACAGQLLAFDSLPDKTALWLTGDNAYLGVQFSRRLTLAQGVLEDSILLDSETEHTYDWVLHCDGERHIENLVLEPAQGLLSAAGAYRFFMLTARRNFVTRFECTVRLAQQIFLVTLKADAPFELLLAQAPAHAATPDRPRQTIIARARKRRISFVATSERL